MHHQDSILDSFGHGIDRGTWGKLHPLLESLLACTTHSHSCGRPLGSAGNGVGESVGTGRWLLDVSKRWTGVPYLALFCETFCMMFGCLFGFCMSGCFSPEHFINM